MTRKARDTSGMYKPYTATHRVHPTYWVNPKLLLRLRKTMALYKYKIK